MRKKNAWLSAILNFFFMGPGYLYNGNRKTLGIFLTLGAFMLTYVELQLQAIGEMKLYGIMFSAVFIVNTVLAIDGYKEAKAINEKYELTT